MTKLLLASLRIEYETTDITIADLCQKHKTKTKDLKGYTLWEKPPHLKILSQPEPSPIVNTIEPLTEEDFVEDIKLPATQIVITKEIETIEDKIVTFKEKAIDAALVFIKKDVRFAEVKEFKDMVSIVDSIDKSFQKNNPDAGQSVHL